VLFIAAAPGGKLPKYAATGRHQNSRDMTGSVTRRQDSEYLFNFIKVPSPCGIPFWTLRKNKYWEDRPDGAPEQGHSQLQTPFLRTTYRSAGQNDAYWANSTDI